MYDRALIVLGSAAYVFEAGVSSVLRVLESFSVEGVDLYASGFAVKEAERVRDVVARLTGVEVRVSEAPQDYRKAYQLFRDGLSGSSIAVPTAGSAASIIGLTMAAAEKGALVAHVYFPFGPWTGMFYPFVPRYIQPVQVSKPPGSLGGVKVDWEKARALMGELGWPRLWEMLGGLALRLNELDAELYVSSDLPDYPMLTLRVRSGVFGGRASTQLSLILGVKELMKTELWGKDADQRLPKPAEEKCCSIATPQMTRKSLKKFLEIALSHLARAENFEEDISRVEDCFWRLLGFRVLKLEGMEDVIIDTNLVYNGIHLTAQGYRGRIMIPYCVMVELLNKRSQAKTPLSKLCEHTVFLAFEALLRSAYLIPSDTWFCDAVLPRLDPLTLEKATLVTADKASYELWNNMYRNLKVKAMLIDENSYSRPDTATLHHAMLTLYAVLTGYTGDLSKQV
ncbi:MAG: hypothetical protein ACPLRJ_07735 [Infirmifilum uzonense]|uniref:hypothetical protein n=1 Tax=Infirmifilum uzonense TaxID=1550241 RepID=UPI003C777354